MIAVDRARTATVTLRLALEAELDGVKRKPEVDSVLRAKAAASLGSAEAGVKLPKPLREILIGAGPPDCRLAAIAGLRPGVCASVLRASG